MLEFALGLLATILLFILIAGFGLSFYLTHRFSLSHESSPAECGLVYEDVSFQASDGVQLRGWLVPAPGSDRAVILLHGHGGSIDPDIQYLPMLHAAGVNVLQFDFRAHGRSDGQMVTFGYLERLDAAAGVAFLKARGMRRVGLVGFSLGGMTAILTAGICPEVDVVVDDGAPARLRSAVIGRGVELGAPAWLVRPAAWLMVAVTSLRLGANLFGYEPVCWVSQVAPRPLYIIHGGRDLYCPEFDELLRAAGPAARLWRLPQAGHTQASVLYPEEYRARLIAFLNETL